MKKLWGRVGMEFLLTDKEYDALDSQEISDDDAGKIIIGAIHSGKGVVNGETYFPGKESVGDDFPYDNSRHDIECRIIDREAVNIHNYPILERPYRRSEVVRNCTAENRISGIIRVGLGEIIKNDLEEFLDLISERLADTVLLSGISCEITGYRGDDILLLVTATCDSEDGFDPNVDEFDSEPLEDKFTFTSTINVYGLIYTAERHGLDYRVTWGSGLGSETWYTKTEMVRNIRNNSFVIHDRKENQR